MNARTIVIAALAMCGSFTTILAVMGYVLGSVEAPPPRPRRPLQPAAIVSPPTGDRDSRGDLPASVNALRGPDVPMVATPLPDSMDAAPAAFTDPDIEQMAQVARSRLAVVEAALTRQVTELKKSRDGLLDEFAQQLATMSVAEATRELTVLDDDTAGMALRRLSPARQKAILRALPEKRRAALQKRLRLAAG